MWCLWRVDLGLFTNIHLFLGLVCVLPLMETMQSFLKFVQRKDIFICDFINLVKVYKSWLILYTVKTTLPLTMMNYSPFRGGYKVIMHKSTQNGSQTTTHTQVDTCSVLLVTEVAFAHVLQLVKTKSKNKICSTLLNFSQGVSFMNSI
jgi:hypothetical protein